MRVECPKCHFENPDDTLYCGNCAAPLPSSEDISALPTKTLETPAEKLSRGTTFASRYEIIEELGKGGMGQVYRVEDKKIKEEVALKLITPEIASDKKTIERFSNELKMARKIAHRNVCKMYDLGEEKGTHYITMEYVPGEDLKSFIRRSRQITVGTAVTIAKQACEGLAEAHRLGVIHRDLKPSNIMIDKDGNTRIMDFGIARSLKTKGVTDFGVMIGTPEYMSPEQVEGMEADQRSDIYSLGVIIYEMVTGEIPFSGETALSIAMKHKSEKPQDPREVNPQISEELSQVILKCLEKSKEKRHQTAEELKILIQNSLFKKAIRYYQHLMGMIQLERENYSKAIKYFQEAIFLLPYTRDGRRDFRPLFINSLAQAYYKAEDLEKARKEYEKIISLTFPRLLDGDIYAESFYMMGKIYEQQGNKPKAIEQYENFLSLWKDADPDIAEVEDAKKRLEVLKKSP